MGQERLRIEDKYPLYRGAKDDRSNLEIVHDKHIARAITYSQTALSILVLGATIAAFLYLILGEIIYLGVFSLFVISAARRFFLSWRHLITAQFIEEVFGVPHTSMKYKLGDRLEQFRKYDAYDEKLKQFRKRRYCLFLDKILKHIPF
ncbi:MAG: hypothetical protein KAV43_04220 [Hadesarchaea archaeon]|nr:hypothetical protein [Hadesarchaea archaeon]